MRHSSVLDPMNFKRFIPPALTMKLSQRPKTSGRLALVYRDREHLHYLVVSYKATQLRLIDSGILQHTDSPSPLAALAEQLRARSIQVQQLIVLLSRSDVDILTLDLPSADAAELPAMVSSEVEQQLGESESPPIVDYYQVNDAKQSQSTDEMQTVLAFCLARSRMDAVRTEAEQAGFRAGRLTVRQLPALSLLRTLGESIDSTLNITLQLYAGEVELALCQGACPLLMRSVRVNLDDCQRVAEQLQLEVERCMSLLPPDVEDLERRWLVDISHQSAQELVDALRARGQSRVDTIRAMISGGRAMLVKGDDPSRASHEADARDLSEAQRLLPTALVGAAWAVVQSSLDVDFANPKKVPTPPNPWIRPVLWGLGGTTAAAVLGFVLLKDVWQLQDEVQRLEVELVESKKLQLKLQEKSDQVTIVEDWLRDQVDWLTALNEISQRLPDGQNATVRRLSASSGGEQASFDLSVQVVQPEDISELESRLRSVKYAVSSKRISQSPEVSEYPWKFETRITFPIEPVSWDQFQAGSLVGAASESADTRSPLSSDPVDLPGKDEEESPPEVDRTNVAKRGGDQ